MITAGSWIIGAGWVLMLILFWISQTSTVTLRIQEQLFSGCTVPPDRKVSELGSSDHEVSPSAGKNTGVVLVPYSCMKMCLYSYSWWCEYFCGPWVSFVMTDDFSVRVTKITSRIGVSWNHSLPIFNLFKLNELWSYYQKQVNQIIFYRKTL